MGFRVADRWFEFQRIDDDITLIWEPHVVPLIRCNIWHVRGRERDLVIDTGLGMASLKAAARDLFAKALTAVATHVHYDHVGGFSRVRRPHHPSCRSRQGGRR
jgi:glyoxylase-like metal-dependent hydrolase (beta-lactamase superfamily II)